MLLSDKTILEYIEQGRITIEPFNPGDIQPSSVDLHLSESLLTFRNSATPFIDLRKDIPELMEEVVIPRDAPFMLHPGEFILGATAEWLTLADDVVARLEGKSSLGRIGLMVHSTAGFVDPGWRGRLTLELANVSKLPITLYRGMRVCQVAFQPLSSPALRPYGSEGLSSRYQNQHSTTASLAHIDFDKHLKAD